MKKTKIAMLVAGLGVMLSTNVFAQTNITENLSFKGFGTVGVVHSNSDGADFVSNSVYQPNGAGATRKTSMSVDSKLGGQLDWKISDAFTATTQVISKHTYDNSWKPEVEWAFIKYNATPELAVRAGRIRPAIYMLSDFLDVNYANTWVRPPVEFYSSAPISRMEGVDVLWTPKLGDYSLLVQPYFGNSKLDITNNGQIKAKKIAGVNLVLSKDEWSARLGYIQTKLSINSPNLDQLAFPALNAICGVAGDTAACEQSAALVADNKKSTFTSMGLTYDNGTYFVSSEYGVRKSDSFVTDAKTWYVTGGTRIGKWTPYVTYSTYKNSNLKPFTGGVFPGSAALGLPSTNAIVNSLMYNNNMDQNTVTVGTRYDIAKNIALKAQFDSIKTKAQAGAPLSGSGLFGNVSPAFAGGSNRVNLFSVSVDFLF